MAIAEANLDARTEERLSGIGEANLTKLDWSAWSMNPLWNSVKDQVAPWHREVTSHALDVYKRQALRHAALSPSGQA